MRVVYVSRTDETVSVLRCSADFSSDFKVGGMQMHMQMQNGRSTIVRFV
jgi:hypothetical protein